MFKRVETCFRIPVKDLSQMKCPNNKSSAWVMPTIMQSVLLLYSLHVKLRMFSSSYLPTSLSLCFPPLSRSLSLSVS